MINKKAYRWENAKNKSLPVQVLFSVLLAFLLLNAEMIKIFQTSFLLENQKNLYRYFCFWGAVQDMVKNTFVYSAQTFDRKEKRAIIKLLGSTGLQMLLVVH